MKRKHLAAKFEDFLAEDCILEECRAAAIKFKIARELEKVMGERNISKAEMAKRLRTSRTGVDRLLDPENTSITLNTWAKRTRRPPPKRTGHAVGFIPGRVTRRFLAHPIVA